MPSVCLRRLAQHHRVPFAQLPDGLQDANNYSSQPLTAMQTDLPVISYDGKNCGEYANDEVGPDLVCAGYTDGTADTCQGDSGGPLTCDQSGGKTYLLGVTSYGKGCALKGYAGFYTDVGKYRHWIWSVMRRHSPNNYATSGLILQDLSCIGLGLVSALFFVKS